MRDRLIEILKGFKKPICEATPKCKGIYATLPDVEGIADYLLANGIIVPPCKVGQTVYVLTHDLDNAIDLIKEEYAKATDSTYVRNPLAYALYQVWKKADRQILAEPTETDLTDKCGSCEWAMPIKGSTKGTFGCYIRCQNPNKVWKHGSSSCKQRTNPKCRFWKPKKGGE